ncbi:MAG: hypothetical protein CL799_10090 [Chromatiales bacterium]|jgi:hypothetical protein|nr:hypothetical protein [Chromatiales bacterium]MDP6149659.1 hypothetical protein [Gammaproteobacteria bacterium]MDP7270492.1 hypothetical protein [Gammaproteobacteria bacterium]HJP05397.1 hypothetical protein [Gammaproteobacteria bacterium]
MVKAVHLDDSDQVAEVAKHPSSSSFKGVKTGFEGREDEIGKAVQMALKTMANSAGYQHEMNDALVKARLHAIQFAKDMGIMDKYVEHDIKTMAPINERVGQIIAKTGDKEAALVGLCERTACHYHLVLETETEPGKRTWKSPWGNVLKPCLRLGMFDLTEQEIHETWYIPRVKGYAKAMGVEIKVSDWNEDGTVTLELVD